MNRSILQSRRILNDSKIIERQTVPKSDPLLQDAIQIYQNESIEAFNLMTGNHRGVAARDSEEIVNSYQQLQRCNLDL